MPPTSKRVAAAMPDTPDTPVTVEPPDEPALDAPASDPTSDATPPVDQPATESSDAPVAGWTNVAPVAGSDGPRSQVEFDAA